MADHRTGAAAPILPAALADAFSPDSSSFTSPLNQRLEDLGIAAEGLRCLVSICVEECSGGLPQSAFARRRTENLMHLAEKMAGRLSDAFSSGELDSLSRIAAKTQGGAA